MPVYTAELYPTAIRNAGVGACNVAAGFALVLTPYLSMLVSIPIHYWTIDLNWILAYPEMLDGYVQNAYSNM